MLHSVHAPQPANDGGLFNSGILGWARRKVESSLQTQLQALREAVPGTFRGSALHFANRGVDWALSNIAPEEEALRRLSGAQAVEVLLPPSPEKGCVASELRALRDMASARHPIHDYWFRAASMCMLVTVPVSILPVPSALVRLRAREPALQLLHLSSHQLVQLYWNSFRVWGNLRGRQGATALLDALDSASVEAAAAAASGPWSVCNGGSVGGGCCRAAAAWDALPAAARCVAVPCELVGQLQADCPNDVDRTKEIEAALAMPGLHDLLRRLGDQAAARAARGSTTKQIT